MLSFDEAKARYAGEIDAKAAELLEAGEADNEPAARAVAERTVLEDKMPEIRAMWDQAAAPADGPEENPQ